VGHFPTERTGGSPSVLRVQRRTQSALCGTTVQDGVRTIRTDSNSGRPKAPQLRHVSGFVMLDQHATEQRSAIGLARVGLERGEIPQVQERTTTEALPA
jgi:hypothetical protein